MQGEYDAGKESFHPERVGHYLDLGRCGLMSRVDVLRGRMRFWRETGARAGARADPINPLTSISSYAEPIHEDCCE
jgi:hypothetical protein